MIKKAKEILLKDGIVAIPTETVYGLAASIQSEIGLKKIFSTKERPFFDPLIVHVSSIEQAKSLVLNWTPAVECLTKKYWPGPLTIVQKKSSLVSDLITSGLETVAIRMPNHPLTLELIDELNIPLAAPSANKFGKTSPTTAEHVKKEFNNLDLFIIDGGPSEVGLESTIISLDEENGSLEISLLRSGQLTLSEICSTLRAQGFIVIIKDKPSKIQVPGHMKHHYMPEKPILFIRNDSPFDFSLQKKDLLKRINDLPHTIEEVQLKKINQLENFCELILSDDSTLAARELYSQLRVSSIGTQDVIIFFEKDLHKKESWSAILDRLMKASTLII